MTASQPYSVGPFALTISCDDASLLASIEELFVAFDPGDKGAPMALVIEREAANLVAKLDGQTVASSSSINELQIALTRVVNRRVLDAEPEHLHLHAGAVTSKRATVLIVGPTMAGKSTSVARLVADGWLYLSDEQVGIDRSGALISYPRSITLRRDSWPMFKPIEQRVAMLDTSATRTEVPPLQLGSIYRGEPSRPTLVVRPELSSGPAGIELLSVADHMQLLVEDSLDLERSAEAGVDALVAVVNAAPAYRIAGRESAEICAAVHELVTVARPPKPMQEHAVVDASEVSLRIPGSLGWLFGDGSAAVYEPDGGVLACLDEHGYRAWRLLAGVDRAAEVPGELRRFVEAMQVAGLLFHVPDA